MVAIIMGLGCTLSMMLVRDVESYAQETSVTIEGKVYNFGEKDHYEYMNSNSFEASDPSKNTYGKLSITGALGDIGSKEGIVSYGVNGDKVDFLYSYSDNMLHATGDSWHLSVDKSKQVADIKLDSNIKKGVLILQTSKDGVTWSEDVMLPNVFEEVPIQNGSFYKANSVQLANGCYYRVIVAYKTQRLIGQNKVLFVKKDEYEYKKTAEIYEFYLYDVKAAQKSDEMLSKSLGVLTKTEKDSGYSGTNDIGIKDPHYGWEIGHFFVSGYTRSTEDKGKNVFLKNVGDQITLLFSLKQDINKLNGDMNLSISDDSNGYDQYFQTAKTDMGRGTLIIRYTDERGVKHEPEIYTNYLEANATTSADTIVKLFEEGDYEVALDYEIKSTPRKVANIEVIPEYTNYRIFFTFSVRNGNCMVYPFDISTGAELRNEAITENGFKLDMAKSKYLTIDVQRSVVTEGANGYVEDIRFNRPAKDGDEYKDEGIYTFNVKNLYTGENTTKKIYVGNTGIMHALAENKMTVSDLNTQVALGAKIEENGKIIMPESKNESETKKDLEPKEESVTPKTEGSVSKVNSIPIPVIASGVTILGIVLFVIFRKRKK